MASVQWAISLALIGPRGAIRAWLFAIAARKAIDQRRVDARAPELVADLEPLAAVAEPAERDDALWAEVRRLPDKQRRAVTLRYLADLSHREIARVMETSEAAARRNVFEGLTRLRAELQRRSAGSTLTSAGRAPSRKT